MDAILAFARLSADCAIILGVNLVDDVLQLD